MIWEGLRRTFGQFGAHFDLLSASKSPTVALFWSHLGPFWAVLGASGRGVPPKSPILGPKIAEIISPKNVFRPFGKINGAYLGEFWPIVRVKGWV